MEKQISEGNLKQQARSTSQRNFQVGGQRHFSPSKNTNVACTLAIGQFSKLGHRLIEPGLRRQGHGATWFEFARHRGQAYTRRQAGLAVFDQPEQ